jgi:hypothetical protein
MLHGIRSAFDHEFDEVRTLLVGMSLLLDIAID